MFNSEEEAKLKLLELKVVDKNFKSINGTQAVVNLGKLVKIPGSCDDNGFLVNDHVFHDGVFYDVLTSDSIDFGSYRIYPVNCVHTFAGYDAI